MPAYCKNAEKTQVLWTFWITLENIVNQITFPLNPVLSVIHSGCWLQRPQDKVSPEFCVPSHRFQLVLREHSDIPKPTTTYALSSGSGFALAKAVVMQGTHITLTGSSQFTPSLS